MSTVLFENNHFKVTRHGNARADLFPTRVAVSNHFEVIEIRLPEDARAIAQALHRWADETERRQRYT